jgi:hypothetical protein
MRRYLSLQQLYDKHLNTAKGRAFMSALIFPDRPVHMFQENGKEIYKIRLCRTFANKDKSGRALTGSQAKKKKTWTFKYRPGTKANPFQKDFEGSQYKEDMYEQGTHADQKFKIQRAKGYYPHIFWKNEWRPLFFNLKSVPAAGFDEFGYPKRRVIDIVLKWYVDRKKTEHRSLARLIHEYPEKVALANEKSAKTKGTLGQPDNHSIIDIKNDDFGSLRGISRKVSKSFNLEV